MLKPNHALAAAAGLLALVALPAIMCAEAPNAERVAAAKELMQSAGVAAQFDEVMPYLMRQLAQSFTAIAPDKGTEIGEVFGQLATKFVDRKGERDRHTLCRKAHLARARCPHRLLQVADWFEICRRAARDHAPIDDGWAALGRPARSRDRGGGAQGTEETRR